MPDADFFQDFMRQQQEQTRKKYHMMNEHAKKGAVLFTGSSLMENFPLGELAMSMGLAQAVYNRGISGYKTMELWNAREECIFELEPSKIFINIGTNDIGDHSYKQEKLIAEYRMLLAEIKERLPQAKVYVMAYYPVNTEEDFGLPKERFTDLFLTRTNEAIDKANEAVQELAEELGFHYINVNEGLRDGQGRLRKEFSVEGLHMFPNAYWVILNNLRPYIEE